MPETIATTGSANKFIPTRPTLPKLRNAVQECRGCALYASATQAVFGEGSRTATLVVIGEQPGDAEDRAGQPFVGPSGKLLDRALADAGIDRDEVHVTNAVKHFKWARDRRSSRRLHKTARVGVCADGVRHRASFGGPEGTRKRTRRGRA
jgi:uracil-DNA glycosylase